LVHVCCFWCGKEVNRSPSALSRVNHVFCSRSCKWCYEEMIRAAVVDADEKNRLSRKLSQSSGCYFDGYGDL